MVAAGIALAGCGGDSLLLPGNGEPAHISAVKGNDQTGTVGQPLGDSLVVEVTDPGGRPVEGVEVLFTAPEGGVLAPSDRDTTGPNGQAAVHYTLSTAAGSQQVQAHAPIQPEANAVAVFSASAAPETAETLVLDAGDGQSAEIGAALPAALTVKAVDRFNNGVPGIEVSWNAEGGGEVNPETAITDADGRASASRTLGQRPGSYSTVARSPGLEGSPLTFRSTALGPELVITTQPSATTAAGVPLTQQPELQLQGPFGTPLNQEGVRVTVQIASGAGSLGGKTAAQSDANGRVRFTDLAVGGETGTRTLLFAADGFTPVSSQPIQVQPGPPSGTKSSLSVGNGTAGSTTSVTAVVRDEFGNHVPGIAGDLAIRITGANPADGLMLTDNGNGSYSASYVPIHSGSDQVTLEFRGDELAGPAASAVFAGPTDPRASTAEVTRSGSFFVRIDVRVTVRDAQGNVVGHGGDQVQISANGGAPRTCAPVGTGEQTCVDNGDGTYADAFVIIANEVTVTILVNGVPISGSPFQPSGG